MPPNFSDLFRRDGVRRLRFKVRRGANYVHDIQFLSGYLHDARFVPNSVVQRGKRLSIAFNRDCWELGYTESPKSAELHTASARLTIHPVSSVRWEVNDLSCLGRELWIESIYPGPAHWETPEATELVISAPHSGFKLSISIDDDFGDIHLNDLETPHLFKAQDP